MSNLSVSIRFAQSGDAALLADLGARAFQQAFGPDNTEEDMRAYLASAFSPEIQARELAAPGSLFLIAELNGEAVGYTRLLSGSSDPNVSGARPIELVRIYVLKAQTGASIGGQLMQASLDYARQQHDVIWLGVWQKNLRAIAFYQKWGFQIAGEHTFQLGSDTQVDWIMAQPLG